MAFLAAAQRLRADPRLPWLAARPSRRRRFRRQVVWTAALPALVVAYLLDTLLGRVVCGTRGGGNVYRVLARKDG